MFHFVKISMLLAIYKFSAVLTLPDVACPLMFQYVQEDNGYFGRLQLPVETLDSIKVHVELALDIGDYKPAGLWGRLATELDQNALNRQLKKGQPIRYRLDFPVPNEPLRIKSIDVNGKTVCEDTSVFARYVINLYNNIALVPGTSLSTELKRFQISEPTPHISVINYSDDPLIARQELSIYSLMCGKEMSNTRNAYTPYVSGGVPIPRGKFPWLTAIYSKISSTTTFICGGTLISRRNVVTAAHCFDKLSFYNVLVYLGRHNLDNYNEVGFVSRGIKKLTLHPEYNKNVYSADADIAILEFEYAVEYNQYIKPICLWPQPDEPIDNLVGALGTVAGWGSQGANKTPTSLPRMVEINIVGREDCLRDSAAFRVIGGGRSFCAGNGDNTGPCLGDSGSGFMIERNGYWWLRGIVAAGPIVRGNCNLRDYVLYCDMAKHLPWVEGNLQTESFPQSDFY